MNDSARKTILLVDEEEICALACAATIREMGYEVITASKGETAVEIASGSQEIDLVLMDIDLGEGMDGPEVAERILERRVVPILFLTALAESEMVEKARGIARYGYVIKNSGNFVLRSSIEMALELFEAHEQLRRARESEERFSIFMEYLPAFAFIKDADLRTLYVNKAMDAALGASAWLGSTVREIPSIPEDIALRMMAQDREALRLGFSKEEEELPGPDGMPRRYETRKFAIPRAGRESLLGGISLDITERVRIEEAYRESEIKYKSLIEHSSDVVFCVDKRGEYKFVNRVFASTFGQSPEYFLGKTFWDIYPKEHADHRQATSIKVFETGESQSVEVVVPLPDRTLYYIAKANPVRDEAGKVVLNLTHAIDITDRKIAEEKVKDLLAEKEILLKEVHHRVKNNLAAMMSIFSLQAETISEEGAARVLRDAEARLRSMGFLYDKLYLKESFSEISMHDYLPPLVQEIVGMFPRSQAVRIETDVADIKIGVKEASTLGILVNELITNSMKYAFAGREELTIRVAASVEGGRATVVVEDDGAGIPEGVDIGNSSGLGFQLVGLLASQLGGSVRVERGAVAKVVLEFPAP